jgi:hypothetical protein
MKTMLSMPRTVDVNSPIHAFGLNEPFQERSFSLGPPTSSRPVLRKVTLTRVKIFGNRKSAFPPQFESNSARHCIQSWNEIVVASDGFNGTLLTSLLLLYENAFSFLFSLNHGRHLLVDNSLGPKPAEHGAVATFSNHE